MTLIASVFFILDAIDIGAVYNDIVIVHKGFIISLILPGHSGHYTNIRAGIVLVFQFKRARML